MGFSSSFTLHYTVLLPTPYYSPNRENYLQDLTVKASGLHYMEGRSGEVFYL